LPAREFYCRNFGMRERVLFTFAPVISRRYYFIFMRDNAAYRNFADISGSFSQF
jgi:hypothetical protein